MLVSAVIPTVGRPELLRAVRSVLTQEMPVEVCVVLDRLDRESEVREMLREYPHRLVLSTGRVGGAEARNIGVANATGDAIAYLDDDDEWMPNKLTRQMPILKQNPDAVITSQAFLVGRSTRVVPEKLFDGTNSVSTYLLERSTLRLRRNFMQSSTLLMTRGVAKKVSWRSQLRRHQDWAILIDLDRSGVPILTANEPLVKVYQGSVGSISRSVDWKASAEWFESYATDASTRAQADFLASIVARGAFANGDWRDAVRAISISLRKRPHVTALVVGVSGMLSRIKR